VFRCDRGDDTRVLTTLCARGCNGHPAFPAPSWGERFLYNSDALRREMVEVCSFAVIASEAKQSTLAFMLRHGLLRRFAPRNDEFDDTSIIHRILGLTFTLPDAISTPPGTSGLLALQWEST
jgi:hypothetical protein